MRAYSGKCGPDRFHYRSQLTPLEAQVKKPRLLPRHKSLALLNDWKSTAANVASALNDLCSRVEEQPEVSGREWLGGEWVDRGAVGLTRYFSKSLAFDSVEEVYRLSRSS